MTKFAIPADKINRRKKRNFITHERFVFQPDDGSFFRKRSFFTPVYFICDNCKFCQFLSLSLYRKMNLPPKNQEKNSVVSLPFHLFSRGRDSLNFYLLPPVSSWLDWWNLLKLSHIDEYTVYLLRLNFWTSCKNFLLLLPMMML